MTEKEKAEAGFAKTGQKFLIEQPFRCDFWDRVSIGENFYSNYNFVILAGNQVTIGDNVLIGPDCGIYAAGSVVTKDIPANVLAGGVPCRVIRKLK